MIKGKEITFYTLVSSFALRAGLIPLPSLILIARSTNRECTFIASNKGLSIHTEFNLISTNLANLAGQLFHRSHLSSREINKFGVDRDAAKFQERRKLIGSKD